MKLVIMMAPTCTLREKDQSQSQIERRFPFMNQRNAEKNKESVIPATGNNRLQKTPLLPASRDQQMFSFETFGNITNPVLRTIESFSGSGTSSSYSFEEEKKGEPSSQSKQNTTLHDHYHHATPVNSATDNKDNDDDKRYRTYYTRDSDLSNLDATAMFGYHDDDEDSAIKSADMMGSSMNSFSAKSTSHGFLSFGDDSDCPNHTRTIATPPTSLDLNEILKKDGRLIPQPRPTHCVPQSVDSCKSTTPSRLAMSTSSSNKPVLYSAIGSLETCSANSFGKIRNQYRNFASRDFSQPQVGALIPPKSGVTMKPVAKRSTGTMKQVLSDSDLKAQSDLLQDKSDTGWEQITQDREAQHATVCEKDANATEALEEKKTKSEQKTKKGLNESNQKRSRRQRQPRKVTINENRSSKGPTKKKQVEMFRPSCDAYTPRVEKKKIQFKPAEKRTPVQEISSTMGTLARPNFRDALRRVAMILQQHIVKIEKRFEEARGGTLDGLFRSSMIEAFSEDKYSTPTYKCTIVRLPMARPGLVYGLRKVRANHKIPTEEEIYEFGHQLFKYVQLSSECSIVCLIYVERLMEVAKVPLVASTWRPIFMCGLLLASKVWQDLSSWNIEFATVYPQFSLNAINQLELQFLKMVKWDLYISSSLYAKYYFALRSLLEKQDFRQRYNRMVGGVGSVSPSDALKVQKRSELIKEEVILQLSRSM
mmetsp:Transcript_3739/g.5505  ORF Transcript_3739/g.5505 Transcript_3739/m.5505 type:complete len:707 (+) Transcript_3739:88-2208(+)